MHVCRVYILEYVGLRSYLVKHLQCVVFRPFKGVSGECVWEEAIKNHVINGLFSPVKT